MGNSSPISVVLVNLFSDELSADEVLVEAIHCEKLLVRATLLDFTMLHDDNLIGILDRTESMSHNYNSLLPAFDKLVERLLHLMLTLCIQG